MELTRELALSLLKEYNQEPFHLRHALTVEAVMGHFARELGYGDEAEFWSTVGLLHDLDFERYPEEHCVKAREIMEARGLDPALIHAVVSHGWGMTGSDAQPEHEMEKVLFACDELTGLIGAAALMRPSKSVQDMELSSLKKKYKASGSPPAAPGRSSPRGPSCWAGTWTACWMRPCPPCGRRKTLLRRRRPVCHVKKK